MADETYLVVQGNNRQDLMAVLDSALESWYTRFNEPPAILGVPTEGSGAETIGPWHHKGVLVVDGTTRQLPAHYRQHGAAWSWQVAVGPVTRP